MTNPKESSSKKYKRVQYGARSSLRQREKAKKKKDTTQQDDSAVLKTINKRLQEKSTVFSEKVQKGEDEIFGDMVASELKGLSCSILRLAFKREVNNPATTQHLSAYNSLFSNY